MYDFKPSVTIDTRGANRNVFNIIGRCVETARSCSMPTAETEKFTSACFTAPNYDAVIEIINKWFDAKWVE